jgi:hypothetical protein
MSSQNEAMTEIYGGSRDNNRLCIEVRSDWRKAS